MFHNDIAKIVRLLLDAGADPHVQDDTNHNYLHYAAHFGCTAAAVCVLIKVGVDPHARSGEGRAPAEEAQISGYNLIATLMNRAARDL
jgi:ankyrin repeat protein